MATGLGAITTVFHVAPTVAAILTHIQEKPATAILVGTNLYPIETLGNQKVGCDDGYTP